MCLILYVAERISLQIDVEGPIYFANHKPYIIVPMIEYQLTMADW